MRTAENYPSSGQGQAIVNQGSVASPRDTETYGAEDFEQVQELTHPDGRQPNNSSHRTQDRRSYNELQEQQKDDNESLNINIQHPQYQEHYRHPVDLSDTRPTQVHKDAQSVTSKITLRTVEERNPYQFIEKSLTAAKDKLEKMKGTKTLVESLTDTGKKKKYLKSENK